MSPEDVLANLITLSETLNLNTHGQTLDYTPPTVAAIAASEPLLLVQHPATTAASVQQLQVPNGFFGPGTDCTTLFCRHIVT